MKLRIKSCLLQFFKTEVLHLFGFILLITATFFLQGCDLKERKTTFRFATSIYVGWMPWFLANENGILQRNAESEGINIEFIRGDYVETINQFAAGGVDAVTLTNIDAFALLIGSGVQTDVVLISSYSNGNDAIVLRNTFRDIPLNKIKKLALVEFSVSHYLLDRFLEIHRLPYSQIEVVNVSDSEIVGAFASPDPTLNGVATWNPIVLEIEKTMQGKRIFDSSSIPFEIADMLVIRREVLKKYPRFATALLKTWFDVMKLMHGDNREKVLQKLGILSGEKSGQLYKEQLKTTYLVDNLEKALTEIKNTKMRTTMRLIESFVMRHRLLPTPPPRPWISYSGDTSKAYIHFNDKILATFSKVDERFYQ